MSISIKNVTKLYNKQKAVDNISFEIKAGEVVGFLGPNGAGKSTTMKMITTFIPQNEGKILVSGIDTLKKPIEVKKKVGYLPEHNPLYLDMYIKEFLLFLAHLHKIKHPKERVKEVIKAVGLTKEERKKIGELSKGYRQRVGLAQAILHNPEVLILDEPTSGLDPNQLVEIRELIKSFGKDKTVLFSTHIMQEVEAICNRVIIINNGKIVADDSIQKIHNPTKNKQTIRVTFDKSISTKLFNIKGCNIQKLDKNQFLFTSNLTQDIRKEIAQQALQHNILVLEMQIIQENLEDVFKKLTQNS